ncbi:MAG: glycosyltransferase [Bacteroidales bacterium]
MNTTILYISYDGMTDNLGQSQVIPYLIGLQKKGYTIHIISCEKADKYAEREKSIAALLHKHHITWHPLPYTSRPKVFSTLYDIKQMQKKAQEIVRSEKVDIVHCRSYVAAQVGVYMKKNHNLPWVFDMRGFWADERIDGGIWNYNSFFFRLLYKHVKQLEKTFISEASHIISLTENGKQEIESWHIYQSDPKPIRVIPCCVDLDFFNTQQLSPKKQKAYRVQLDIRSEQFVLSYLGSFGTWYMTEEMFDFFKVVYDKNKDAVFLCITPDNPEELERIAFRKDIPASALRIVSANRDEVPLYASLSDWSLFFIRPLYSKKASSPTKMGELLGLGIPLVCNAGVGDVETIMQSCEHGHVVHNHTEDEYARIAESLVSETVTSQTAKQLREVSRQYYDLQKGVDAYAEVYRQIINA